MSVPGRDPRVDVYIAEARPFARPILRRLRTFVHRGCPGVSETLKWRMPTFEYHGILATMAAFRGHCSFGFWHPSMRPSAAEDPKAGEAMGQFGRIRTLADLPAAAVLMALVRRAARVNRDGTKAAPKPRHPRTHIPVPADLRAGLERAPRARASFEALAPGRRREYLEWIVAAKRPETRQRRIARALEQLASGRSLHWKYQRS